MNPTLTRQVLAALEEHGLRPVVFGGRLDHEDAWTREHLERYLRRRASNEQP